MLLFLQHTLFRNPEAFFLLALPIGYAIWYGVKHTKTFASLKSSGSEALEDLPTSSLSGLRHLPVILHILGLIALVVALARPQERDDWSDSTVEGIDIVLAMDVSSSMLATDFKPNRLGVAKEMASKFVEKRENDRLGLIIFAGESFTQCPLTIDHRVVQNLLLKVNAGNLRDGTALGMGLATSVHRLKESEAKSKVVVLLTDGVNNQGNVSPKTAAQIASTFGIKVYSIGVGTNQEYSYTPQGKVKNEIDEKTLKEVASETGGKYFRAKSAKELEAVYAEIDKLETSEISVTEYNNFKEKFFLYAIVGFSLILAGVVLKNTVLRTLP